MDMRTLQHHNSQEPPQKGSNTQGLFLVLLFSSVKKGVTTVCPIVESQMYHHINRAYDKFKIRVQNICSCATQNVRSLSAQTSATRLQLLSLNNVSLITVKKLFPSPKRCFLGSQSIPLLYGWKPFFITQNPSFITPPKLTKPCSDLNPTDHHNITSHRWFPRWCRRIEAEGISRTCHNPEGRSCASGQDARRRRLHTAADHRWRRQEEADIIKGTSTRRVLR